MNILNFLAHRSKAVLASAVAASIFGGASSAVMIAFINSAIAEPLPLGSKWVYLFMVITLIVLVSRLASEFLLINLSQKAIYELRMALCQQILSTGLRKLEEIGAAKLLVVLTDDITVITHAMMDIPTICVSFMMFVVSFIYLAWLSTKLLIFVLLFVLSGVTLYYLLQRRGLSRFFLAREEEDSLFKHFRALLEGSKELKINKEREEIFINKFLNHTSLLLKKHNSSSLKVFATANVLAIILFYLLVGCLLLLFPHFISVERSVLTGYIFVVLFMLAPLGHFLAAIPNIGRANIVLNKISSLGILTPHKLIPDTLNIQNWRCLELASITHSYYREDEGRCFTLGPVDFTFNRGEIVFLVGGNGSGKTTLIKLITGLYTPDSGQIRLDDKLINESNKRAYQQLFSVIFYDFFLFQELFINNQEVFSKKVESYLKKLQLSSKVKIANNQFSTTELSQGQRKRLALLTSYLEDRDFYIFDEWAADQDPVFKEIFYKELLPDLKAEGKTILVISHDDKYFKIADRIIKLDYGKVESS